MPFRVLSFLKIWNLIETVATDEVATNTTGRGRASDEPGTGGRTLFCIQYFNLCSAITIILFLLSFLVARSWICKFAHFSHSHSLRDAIGRKTTTTTLSLGSYFSVQRKLHCWVGSYGDDDTGVGHAVLLVHELIMRCCERGFRWKWGLCCTVLFGRMVCSKLDCRLLPWLWIMDWGSCAEIFAI